MTLHPTPSRTSPGDEVNHITHWDMCVGELKGTSSCCQMAGPAPPTRPEGSPQAAPAGCWGAVPALSAGCCPPGPPPRWAQLGRWACPPIPSRRPDTPPRNIVLVLSPQIYSFGRGRPAVRPARSAPQDLGGAGWGGVLCPPSQPLKQAAGQPGWGAVPALSSRLLRGPDHPLHRLVVRLQHPADVGGWVGGGVCGGVGWGVGGKERSWPRHCFSPLSPIHPSPPGS